MDNDVLLEEFIRHLRVERGLSRNTWLSYGYQLKGYLAFLAAHGKGPLSAGREDVLAYLEAKKNAGRRSATLFIAAMAIRQFHRFLLERGHAGTDPTMGMRLPKFKQRLPEPLSTAEMERLLAAPTGTRFAAVRDRAMMELMYATGMRVSELLGLRLGQVDLGAELARPMGKGSKERLIPFGARAAAALSRYLAARATYFPAAPDILFLNARGQGLTRSGFGWRLAAAARRAGLSCRLTPHQIRHSFATHMLEGGADIRVVQEVLGHSSLLTTQKYTHVSVAFMRKTCETAHPGFRSTPTLG